MSMIGNVVAVLPEQLQSFIEDPELIEAFLYPEDGDAEPDWHVDLDKAWHAIHFTLNGKTWEGEGPLFLAVLGGEEVGEDIGYGPARYLVPEHVKAVSAALSAVTPEVFGDQFNPSALAAAEIYPDVWDREGGDGLEYVQPFYIALRNFYMAAAERGDAVLIYLN